MENLKRKAENNEEAENVPVKTSRISLGIVILPLDQPLWFCSLDFSLQGLNLI